MERWKAIKGFSDKYSVSDQGRIRSQHTHQGATANRILKGGRAGSGYRRVILHDGAGSHKSQYIHQLVARAFVKNPHNKPFVNHKDGDKTNNCVANLEWVTHSENHVHSRKVLKKTVGEANGQAKLTDVQVTAIKEASQTGLSQREIAEQFSISQSHVSRIVRGVQRNA